MRALGRENLTNSNPVERAVNAMPTKISTEQTEWPYNVAGYISPKPTVADVSMLKKNASAIEPGRALAIAGLHPATGGSGLELCSGDMLLEALVACAGVTLKSVATAVEVPLKTGNVIAEGDLDFRGTLGVDKEAPVGFAEIRLRFDVDTDAPQEKLDLLLKLTERYCVVYQTIKNGPKVSVTMHRV